MPTAGDEAAEAARTALAAGEDEDAAYRAAYERGLAERSTTSPARGRTPAPGRPPVGASR